MSMGLRINTNTPSLAARRTLGRNVQRMADNFRKMAAGERITRASDDAAGLAISENIKSRIRSKRQANRNANDAISLIQTTESGLNEIANILIRLRELSIQASSDTVGRREREFSDIEFQQLKEEIDRISQVTEFNGVPLLNGNGGMMEFQVGAGNDPILDRLRYNAEEMDAGLSALSIVGDNVATKEGARSSLERLDDALVNVNGMRATLGAMQNRLTSTINNLEIGTESLAAANSRIRDVDVASETADLAKNNILVQAGTAVLSQANQYAQYALKLLG